MTGADVMASCDVQAGLRGWAWGLHSLEAAVESLILSCGGRFACQSWPWVCVDRGCVWLDADQIHPHIGVLSSGEQRILGLVEALATGRPIDRLGDQFCALDRYPLQLVLAALAHAAGSHAQAVLSANGDGWVLLPPIVDWPTAA